MYIWREGTSAQVRSFPPGVRYKLRRLWKSKNLELLKVPNIVVVTNIVYISDSIILMNIAFQICNCIFEIVCIIM